MLGKLRALMHRRLSVPQRFALLSFFCILAVTVLVCGAAGTVLRAQLIKHDGAVIGDLASRLFTSSVPASFFSAPGAAPAGAERLREFARSELPELRRIEGVGRRSPAAAARRLPTRAANLQ